MINSKDIPQADVLSKVASVADLVYGGATSDADIASGIGFDSRQGRYYRLAAELLGLISNDRNVSSLTDLGRELVTMSSEARASLIKRQVLSLPVFKTTTTILKSSDVGFSKDGMGLELSKHVDSMALSTINRRVSTLFSWLEELDEIVRRGDKYFSIDKAIPEVNKALLKRVEVDGVYYYKLKTIKFEQNSKHLLLFIATSGIVYRSFDVSRRIEDKELGYQRSFSKSRVNDIKRYISIENGTLPNSVLVNLDEYKYSDDGDLLIKDGGTAGFIIDGQHRVKGSYDADPELLLPVVATLDLSVQEQAQLFVKINRTQKGVPSSLYLDLLELTDGSIDDLDGEDLSAERRSVELAKQLNEDPESPLYDLVRTTGDSGRGISLSQFVSVLIKYVDPSSGKFVEYLFQEQYQLFKIYFKAIKATFLDLWNEEDTIFFKTTLFGGLVKAFYEIHGLARRGGMPLSTQTLMSVLENLKDFDFSKVLTGTGIKAQDSAADAIVTHIKKKHKEQRLNSGITQIIED